MVCVVVPLRPVYSVVHREPPLQPLQADAVSSHHEEVLGAQHESGAGEGSQLIPGDQEERVEAGQLQVAGESLEIGEALEEVAHDTILKVSLTSVLIVQNAHTDSLQLPETR